jgi:branched-chain amino acid transport system substrate-binding protein
MNKWVFRNYYSTRTQGEAIADFLAKHAKPKRVGILHLTDDYGVTGKNELAASLAQRGLNVVATEGYDKAATDLRAQVTKLQAGEVDAICVIAYDEAVARAFQGCGHPFWHQAAFW